MENGAERGSMAPTPSHDAEPELYPPRRSSGRRYLRNK
jgi:hypothetical protein